MEVLAVEKVLLVLFEGLVIGSPGSPNKGVGLARRAPNEDPIRLSPKCLPYQSIRLLAGILTKFKAVHSAGGSFQSGPHIWVTQQGLVFEIAPGKSVVSMWYAPASFEISKGVPERERRMR